MRWLIFGSLAVVLAFAPSALATDEQPAEAEKKAIVESTTVTLPKPFKPIEAPAKPANPLVQSERTGSSAGTPDAKPFVDRDGDGIQDGKEARFRHSQKSHTTRGQGCNPDAQFRHRGMEPGGHHRR